MKKRENNKEKNDGMLIESYYQGFMQRAILFVVGAISANLIACSIEINIHIKVTVYLLWIVLFFFFSEFMAQIILNLKGKSRATIGNDFDIRKIEAQHRSWHQ